MVYDYETETIYYYAAPKGEAPLYVGSTPCLNSSMMNDRSLDLFQFGTPSHDIYFDNFAVNSYADCYTAINACTNTDEIINALALYENLGLIKANSNLDKAEDETEVYKALLGKSFSTTTQVQTIYDESIQNAITGIKITAHSLTFDTSSIDIKNTKDTTANYCIYHLKYKIEDNVKTLLDYRLDKQAVDSLQSCHSAYTFAQQADETQTCVKTLVTDPDTSFPLKLYIYGTDENTSAESSTADFTMSDFSLDSEKGILKTTVSGGENGEILFFSFSDKAYYDAVFADIKGGFHSSFSVNTVIEDNTFTAYTYSAGKQTASKTSDFVTSTVKPLAKNVTVSGTNAVGYDLKASYTYSQIGGIAQKNTLYQWYYSDTRDGTKHPITGAASDTLHVTSVYGEKYLSVAVTPISDTDIFGEKVFSEAVAILSAPKAVNVTVSGAGVVGNTLTASYEYIHIANPETDSVLSWLSLDENKNAIEVLANGSQYVPTVADVGKTIVFEVIPKTNVIPTDGEAVRSREIKIEAATPETEPPKALELSIDEQGDVNTLSADYHYKQTNNTPEKNSKLQWYICDTENGDYTPIDGATYKELSYIDAYQNQYVKFSVVPTSALDISGTLAFSSPFRIYELPVISDLSIDGTIANDGTVTAKYSFPALLFGNDASEISWYIDDEKVASGATYTIPADVYRKNLTVQVLPKSNVFPKYAVQPVSKASEIIEYIPYAPQFIGDYVTKTTVYPAGKISSNMVVQNRVDMTEAALLSNIPGTNCWIQGFSGSGIISLDMRFFITLEKDRKSTDSEIFRIKDTKNNAWFELMKIDSEGAISGTDSVLQENSWYNLRIRIDTEKQSVDLYIGKDKKHLALIKTSTGYKFANDALISILELTVSNTKSKTFYFSDLEVASIPTIWQSIRSVENPQSLKALLQNYCDLQLFSFPTDYDSTDSETAVLQQVLENKEYYTETTQVETALNTAVQKHIKGGRVISCKLQNQDDVDLFDSIIQNVSQLKTATTLKNTTDSDNTYQVITAVYKKSANQDKTLTGYDCQTIRISAMQQQTIVSAPILCDVKSEYSVRVFVWDQETAANKVLCETAFNDFDKETVPNTAEPVASSEISTVVADSEQGIVTVRGNVSGGDKEYLTMWVENPDGELVFIDQLLSVGENGTFDDSFSLSSPAKAGTYSVNVKKDTESNTLKKTFVLRSDAAKPVGYAAAVSGDTYYGSRVNAVYQYFQLAGISEGDSVYQWYIADDIDGNYQPIDEENTNSLLLDKAFGGKYIKFSVQPKTSSNLSGETLFLTEPIRVLMLPEVSNVKITGDAVVGNTISGTYSFVEPLFGNKESGSSYTWYRGTKVVGNQQFYQLTKEDVGYYLTFEVTPEIAVYPFKGKTVKSDSIKVSGTVSTGIKGGGGSVKSSGGSSGGDIPLPPIQTDTQQPEQTVLFADMAGHWANDTINRLYKKGVIRGIDENTFCPDQEITRAEFAAMINRATGNTAVASVSYKDCDERAWYYPEVCKISAVGIMSGDGGSFRPNDYITRQEMAVVACRVYRKLFGDVPAMTDTKGFSDYRDISAWAYDSVLYCLNAKLVTGDNNGCFYPQNYMTRAEAATMMERIMALQ